MTLAAVEKKRGKPRQKKKLRERSSSRRSGIGRRRKKKSAIEKKIREANKGAEKKRILKASTGRRDPPAMGREDWYHKIRGTEGPRLQTSNHQGLGIVEKKAGGKREANSTRSIDKRRSFMSPGAEEGQGRIFPTGRRRKNQSVAADLRGANYRTGHYIESA